MLNTSFVLDNKLFWKIIKLVEGDKLLQDHSEVAEELNNFF